MIGQVLLNFFYKIRVQTLIVGLIKIQPISNQLSYELVIFWVRWVVWVGSVGLIGLDLHPLTCTPVNLSFEERWGC